VVSRTKASDSSSAADTSTTASASYRAPTAKKYASDVFDDSRTLSELERTSIQSAQRTMINTTLFGSQPILTSPPNHIPPNISASQLEVPKTIISTLPNGIKVVSQETYGQVCCIGLLANMGSRLETTVGTCHLLELTGFQSTPTYQSPADIQETLQKWGGTSFCHIGNEQALWCLDILRPNVQQGFELLKDVVLHANFTDDEVAMSKQAIRFQWEDMKPEPLVPEAVLMAAYGSDQQLGRPHICPLDQLDLPTAKTLRDFMDLHVWKNPKGLVISGAGIGHEELVDLATRNFGHLEQHTIDNGFVKSIYRGGKCAMIQKTKEGFTNVAIGLEVGGWSSEDLATTCVLQTLLGGGSSFSAGGPGKGMYSRLYRQVLNRNSWAESTEAFTIFHQESGILGISGSSVPDKSEDLALVIKDNILTLSNTLVTDEELDRARNMLKNNVLTQLESRLVLFEDMGRQVSTYGHREDSDIMSGRIEAVTKYDIMKLVQRAILKPPTVAAVGDDVSFVPPYDEIKKWFV